MKKLILNESDKKVIISAREKAIMESFAKTFNSIKRIDENEVPPVAAPAQKLTPQEQQILNDILSGGGALTEDFNAILDKVKQYASKGLMTAALVGSLMTTPGMSAAEQSSIKQIAGVENVQQKSDTSDITKMDNTQVYNLVLKLVKANPERAAAVLQQMRGSSQADKNDISMLQSFASSLKYGGKPIGNAEYMGGRFKTAGKFTQQLVNTLQTNVQHGGFGFN